MTDGRTDGQTDRRTDTFVIGKTGCILQRGKKNKRTAAKHKATDKRRKSGKKAVGEAN